MSSDLIAAGRQESLNEHPTATLSLITGLRLCPRRRCLRDRLCSRLYGAGSTVVMRDPFDQFPADSESANTFEVLARLQKTTAEMRKMIIACHAVISQSKQLMTEADDILARR